MPGFPTANQTDAKARRKALLKLWLTSVLFGLLLIPGIGAARISPLIFNAPDAGKNPKLIAFTLALASYPFVAVLALLASWVLYALKRYRIAIWISLLPALSLLAGLACFILLEI